MIIDSQATFKSCIGGTVNNSVTWDLISYTYDIVMLNHFQPLIGASYLDVISADPSLETNRSTSKYWFQRACARLMVYEHSNSPGMMTPTGLVRNVTENIQPTYKYQETKYSNNMLRTGYQCLDNAMKLAHAEGMPWETDPANKALTRWVAYSSELSELTGMEVNRWDYERIAAAIDDIGEMVIAEIIDDLSRELLLRNYYIGALNAKEKELVKYIRKGVANLAISESLERGWVQLVEGRVVVKELTSSDSYHAESLATGEAMNVKLLNHNLWGSKYIVKLLEYLTKNKLDFPEIWAHYSANYPEEEGEEVESDECNNCGECGCHSEIKRGIIQF